MGRKIYVYIKIYVSRIYSHKTLLDCTSEASKLRIHVSDSFTSSFHQKLGRQSEQCELAAQGDRGP